MLTAIRQWVIKTMMKNNTGVVQTLPKRDLIELNTQITAQRLMQNGVEPNSLKNADQVENAVNAIESRPPVQEGIRSTKSAKIIDMEGKEIKDPKNIMGGKEINQQTLNEELMKTDNPFSDLVNTPRPKTIKEREAEVLAAMEKNNKEAVQRIKNRKMVEEAIDNASPGFAGDVKYDAQLVADDLADKRFGKDFYDLDQKQQLDLYDEAYTGLSDSRFKNKPDPEDMATGGRAGFKGGMSKAFLEFLKKFKVKPSGDDLKDFLSKRQFMKDMVGNTKKNQQARELAMLKEAMNDAKGYQFPSGKELRTDIEKTIGPILLKDRKLNSEGGRVGFKTGLGKRFLDLIKGKPKLKFDEDRFRKGPIDLKFLENIDKKDLAPFIRSRDTMGPGGYGMYDNFADMPAGLRAAELIKTIKGPRNEINYKAAELFLGKKLKGNETADELIQMLNRQEMRADGGRIGYAEGTPELKLYPRASGMQSEQEVGPGIKISERDLNYGITGLLEGDKFFGGAEIDKGKVKIDVVNPEGNTLFKDTIGKEDAVNFILGMGDPKGEKFQIKTDDDFENIQLILKKSFADGGRANFDEGGMSRRTFLKLLGGLAAIPIVGKFIKPMKVGKKITKVPIIKTDNVAGKPEWFDALVNKVIIEGDDVTKKFATAERQSIHQKTLDDGSVVRVTEDVDDGAIRVEYESEANVFGDDVLMQYKKPLPDEGDPRPAAEFTTAESGPVGRQTGPDDYDLDVDEVGGSSIEDLDSDVSKLKEFATGQKPTMKEVVQNIKRKDKAKRITEDPEAQSDAVIRRQGDYVPEYDDYASGGIARMLGE